MQNIVESIRDAYCPPIVEEICDTLNRGVESLDDYYTFCEKYYKYTIAINEHHVSEEGDALWTILMIFKQQDLTPYITNKHKIQPQIRVEPVIKKLIDELFSVSFYRGSYEEQDLILLNILPLLNIECCSLEQVFQMFILHEKLWISSLISETNLSMHNVLNRSLSYAKNGMNKLCANNVAK